MNDQGSRPPRDTFHLALLIGALFLAFLIVLGIAAWNTRIAFLPLTPKPAPLPAPSLRQAGPAAPALHLPIFR